MHCGEPNDRLGLRLAAAPLGSHAATLTAKRIRSLGRTQTKGGESLPLALAESPTLVSYTMIRTSAVL